MKINEEQIREIVKDEIGKFYHLNEIARVGILENRYDVTVWTDDAGFIPHVHITDRGTRGQEFNCCVRLETNAYFKHGYHQDVMPSGMRKAFYAFMCEPSRNVHYRNNYEAAVNLWNDNNSSSYVQIREDVNGNVIVPDYTTMA